MTAGDSYGRLDDDDYPAYTMGRAAEMLGTTQGFLRAIGEARLITPLRSEGGHRRYSRYQLRIAARAWELVDHGLRQPGPAVAPRGWAPWPGTIASSQRSGKFGGGATASGRLPHGMTGTYRTRESPGRGASPA